MPRCLFQLASALKQVLVLARVLVELALAANVS
jgi:hypothetical protein